MAYDYVLIIVLRFDILCFYHFLKFCILYYFLVRMKFLILDTPFSLMRWDPFSTNSTLELFLSTSLLIYQFYIKSCQTQSAYSLGT